jgi:stage V sporulation protein D (sporulation-specific penicillin-binding protein)
VLLVLDEPGSESGIYISGGGMAAPIVGNILAEVLPYIGVTPQYSDEELEALNVTVPKLAEKSTDEAISALRKLGLTFDVQGAGTEITGQLPAPNSVIAPNSPVRLFADVAVPSEERMVPNIAGKNFGSARRAIEEAGLYVRSVGALSTIKDAIVSVQSIEAGSFVPVGTVIEVTLVDKTIQGNY